MNSLLTRAGAQTWRLASALKCHPRTPFLYSLTPHLGGLGVLVSGPVKRSAAHFLYLAIALAGGVVQDLHAHVARVLGA